MSIRTERVAGEIQKALASLFQRDFSFVHNGLLTVTAVRMSPDLRHCKAYISIITTSVSREDVLRNIDRDTPRIRTAMAKMLRLRFVPELRFYLDDSLDEVDHIERLFKEVRQRERSEHDSAE